MNLEEIRQRHKKLHGSRKVQKQALAERLEMGWSIEDTINIDNRKRSHKIVLSRFGKGKTTNSGKRS